ncbi:MAG TPA: carbohydrate kinase family protein [Dehalococcoidia bacterium]
MAVVTAGSIAFDHIMVFRDYFANHILPDKVHVLNVSFLVDGLERRRGGTGANIAYNLALLGERPVLLGTAGHDFSEYREWLERHGVDTSHVRVLDEYTAAAFIITDLADNQITGFYPGAMGRAAVLSLRDVAAPIDYVVISPNAPDAMVKYAQEARELGVRHVFDPGQTIPAFSAQEILDAAAGAAMVVGNDYEFELIRAKTGKGPEDLLELASTVVVTRGEHGSAVLTREGTVEVPVAPPAAVVDPTGAGDAYRAGLLAGLLRGLDLPRAARMGALAAAYAVERHGTQEHHYTFEEFEARYRRAFGEPLPAAARPQ